MDDLKLTLEDQFLANLVIALTVGPVPDAAEEDMFLDLLRPLVGLANRDHPFMSPLIEAADGLLDARTYGESVSQCAANYDARAAAARFAKWRAGLAQAALDARNAKQRKGAA